MAIPKNHQGRGELVLLCTLLAILWELGTALISYSVPEEVDKGILVGNISKDLRLEPWELADRGVRIVSRGRTQLFSLNPQSGSLITAGRIDREELCAQSARCLVNINILVEDGGELFGVEIEITDINDNNPKFHVDDLEVKINEIAAPGARYPLPEAIDPDVGVNSLQSYQLTPSHHFSLDVQTRDDGTLNPELVLEHTLDREEEAVHHLVLTASDGGDPRRSSTVRIQVTVLDTNDNAPVFAQPIYRAKVLENVPPGTLLLTVRASDPDEGANGKVAYKFRKINEKQSPIFQLNENTGEIFVAKSLDYEECSFYEMEIQAEDVGALLGRTKVLIMVEDVNDNRPEVIITSLFNPVLENSLPGTVIAFLNVHDQDSGKNGQVVCYTHDNLPFKLEKSIDNYYRLVTWKYLDREKESTYNITVTASDLGSPPLSTETYITLTVADTNDNAPIFPHASYSAYIPENNLKGASIFSLTAHDPDSQENAQVTYSVTEDTIQGAPLSSYVSINSNTGVLYALRSFDYEQIQDLQLLVIASDSGDPSLSSNVSLSLYVLDQNDNVPEILYPTLPTDGSTGVELAPRSAEPGYLVTKVVAVDRDSGQNAWLSYRLLKASEPGLFSVGLHTGEVRTARVLLDRDAFKQSLIVTVQDHGQPPLSATVTLTVAVANSIPEVLADLSSIRTPGVSDDSDLTLHLVVAVAVVSCVFLAFVIVLLALRLQRWQKSQMLQASGGGLTGVHPSQFVGIDGTQAFLQTYSHKVSLTAGSQTSHVIFPQPNYADMLISQESYEKNDSLLTSIDFHECKDEVAQALSEQIRYRIPEEMPMGSVVGNLAKDLGFHVLELPTRKLHISSEKSYFTVSSETGELLVSGRLDREQICGRQQVCALDFEAVAENPLNFYHVSVEIEDINDHAPKFAYVFFDLQISESAQPGTRFILEVAEDADIALNSLQNYKLSPSPNFSLINKEKQDGSKYPEMILEKTLDREQQSFHRLILTALDGGNPPLSGTTELRIQVTDANDNPPVFNQEVYRVSLRENVPPGTAVLQVSAIDQDEGINSEITYSFYRTGQVFSINSKSGEITTQKVLDFEDTKEYSLLVEGRDGGGLVSQCTVEINIQDENDNSPEVTFHSLLEMILENAVPGTLIALIKIHDQDSGENGEVNCLLEGEVPFKIISSSKNSYKLVTDRNLDRELTPEYNVTITAIDRGKPPLSSSILVTLNIGDVNDNAPIFHQASYVVYVAENNPPGASIAQVSASDPDLGPNGQVSYSIAASDLEPRALLSYVSVSEQSGVVFAQRAFDHEQLRSFELILQARDHGSPALSANVSLRVLVGDRNDNAPRVLYPALAPDGSALFDTVPRASEPGYLVTKVVAVDADSGHNAWLSYHVLQASDPGLFSLGLRTGEVRTARALGDRDAARQRLLVAVRDGGQPPLSATATLHLVFADSLQEALPDLSDRPLPPDPQAELQFYLVVALALISVLFLLAVILAIALRLRHSSSNESWGCFQPGMCAKPGPVIQPNYSEGTLPYSYNLCVAHTGKTEFNFLQSNDPLSLGQNILCSESPGTLFPLCNSSESTCHPEALAPIFTQSPAYPTNWLPSCNETQSLISGALRHSPEEKDHQMVEEEEKNLMRQCTRTLWEARASQIRYSVPEEREKGYNVGNISKDLGLETRELADRGVRIVSRGRTQLFSLNPQSGSLITADRIDREELCAQSARCLVHFKVLVEDSVKLYGIEIEVRDINDNAPKFEAENLEVKINEVAAPGARYPLPEAIDPDVGVNSLQSYQLSPSHHFSLDVQTRDDGTLNPELVLEHTLDREEEAVHHLVLTASDGGDPRRSSTVRIQVTVLDTNDNAPVFAQPIYRAKVLENVPPGTLLLTVRASDPDEGANGKVAYKFRKINEKQSPIFQLNENTGEIFVAKSLDYEECSFYEMEIQAEDGGGLKGRTKVLIMVEDVNDNRPEVTITSLFSPVREDAPQGTVIVLFNAHDQDSGKNGQVFCSIQENLPFKLENSIEDYYRLLTAQILDREKASEYNITVTATDRGMPSLSTEIHITLYVTDINDNPPAFSQASYSIYLPENNLRGTSIFSVTAQDPDNNENARVTYSLVEDTIQGAPLSSYVSINSETGVLYALRSFDYEQFGNLQIQVRASDNGNPPLSSNASLSLFVLDQNDNTPEILYPTLPTDGSTGVELAPRSAEPGYLVTKVVAVDRDSGQNAWLSYHLLKASEAGLFSVGLHTGEVRTARALLDRDAIKQSLVVAVQDHGQPPLSATVTFTVAVAESIPNILADLGSMEIPADSRDSDLTLYLVVAVAAVSCLFLTFVLILLGLKFRRWHSLHLLQAENGGLTGLPTSHFVDVEGVQAFLQTCSQEFSLTADSRKSHIIFPQPNYADMLISQESCEKKETLGHSLDSKFPIEDTPLVPVSWIFFLYCL
ncbi:protocadherin gamma-A8-like [Marmota monax]|uniref:Protocadherin gamma-A8-like n=1 Tax=Marmota monax TaxID=9995 RepID=A0A834QEP7_MARMO|nr:protocadherin gamma-A8-like [Marmota monax]